MTAAPTVVVMGVSGSGKSTVGEALAVAESDVRLFPSQRWLATATAPDPIVARDRVRRVASALRKLA